MSSSFITGFDPEDDIAAMLASTGPTDLQREGPGSSFGSLNSYNIIYNGIGAGRQGTSSAFELLGVGIGNSVTAPASTLRPTVDIHSDDFKQLLGKTESELDNIMSSYLPTKERFKQTIQKQKDDFDDTQKKLLPIREKRVAALIYLLKLDQQIAEKEADASKLCELADGAGQSMKELEDEFVMVSFIKKTPVFTTFNSKEEIIDYVGRTSPNSWKRLTILTAEALARTLDNGGFQKTQWCSVNNIKTSCPRDKNGDRVNVKDFSYYLMHDVMQIDGAHDAIYGTATAATTSMPANRENGSSCTTTENETSRTSNITMKEDLACAHYGIDPNVWVTFPPECGKKLIEDMEVKNGKHRRDESDDTPIHQNKKHKANHFFAGNDDAAVAATTTSDRRVKKEEGEDKAASADDAIADDSGNGSVQQTD